MEQETIKRFQELRKNIKDMLGFEAAYFGLRYTAFQKEDEKYTYIINVCPVSKSIGLYKVKKLKATSMPELFKEVNQEHKAEPWMAPLNVVELSLKLFEIVDVLSKEKLKKSKEENEEETSGKKEC